MTYKEEYVIFVFLTKRPFLYGYKNVFDLAICYLKGQFLDGIVLLVHLRLLYSDRINLFLSIQELNKLSKLFCESGTNSILVFLIFPYFKI